VASALGVGFDEAAAAMAAMSSNWYRRRRGINTVAWNLGADCQRDTQGR
jgi:hypothetical protein